MVVGDPGCVRRVSRDYWAFFDLGSGTSGALLHDLHPATVEELAGERRICHCRLFAGAGIAFCCELPWIEIDARLVDVSGNSLVNHDGGLHRVSFRASQSARPLAESVVATAPIRTGVAARFGRAPANRGTI